VLRRLAAGQDGVDSLVFYDTLPLVRSLSRDSAKLEDLPCGSASTPAGRITRWTTRSRWPGVPRAGAPAGYSGAQGGAVNLLDYLGSAWRWAGSKSGERDMLSSSRSSTRWADTAMRSRSTRWSASAAAADPRLPWTRVIRRLGGRALMTRLRPSPIRQRYPARWPGCGAHG